MVAMGVGFTNLLGNYSRQTTVYEDKTIFLKLYGGKKSLRMFDLLRYVREKNSALALV